MPIKNHANINWAGKIDQKEVAIAKEKLIVWTNIYHWRKYRWLSQSELAIKSWVTQAIISNLEKGDYNPSLEVLNRISSALDVSLELLTKTITPWKMIEAIDYLLFKIKSFDILKAMKLLYFIDLESFKKTWLKIIWINYYRRHWGPFNSDIYILESIYKKENNKDFIAENRFDNYLLLTDYDTKLIDSVLKAYWSKDWATLMNDSYNTEPMKSFKKWDNEWMWNLIF